MANHIKLFLPIYVLVILIFPFNTNAQSDIDAFIQLVKEPTEQGVGKFMKLYTDWTLTETEIEGDRAKFVLGKNFDSTEKFASSWIKLEFEDGNTILMYDILGDDFLGLRTFKDLLKATKKKLPCKKIKGISLSVLMKE